jgi:hypothetical protein
VSTDHEHEQRLRSQLRQVRLCTLVLEDINNDVYDPSTADSRADLLIATENLVVEAIKLVEQARALAWNQTPMEIPPNTVI